MTPGNRASIARLRESAEFFIRRAAPRNEGEQQAIAETLLALETIDAGTHNARLLAHDLRAAARRAYDHRFPAIAAHLEMIAAEILPPPAPEPAPQYWWQAD